MAFTGASANRIELTQDEYMDIDQGLKCLEALAKDTLDLSLGVKTWEQISKEFKEDPEAYTYCFNEGQATMEKLLRFLKQYVADNQQIGE